MSNDYITENILAQQAGGNTRLSPVELREITEREQHVLVSIANNQRQLEIVTAMQKWYKENELATAQLEDATQHYSQVNKQYLALRGEEIKLQRLDTLYDLHPIYDRIGECRCAIEGIMQQEALVAQDIEHQREVLGEAARNHEVMRERLEDAVEQQRQRQGIVDRGYIIDGEMHTIETDLHDAEEALSDATHQLGESEASLRNRQKELGQTKQQLDNLTTHYQALAVHQQLFEQYHAVNDKLQLYNTEAKHNDSTHQLFTANNRENTELSLLHNRLKKELQDCADRHDALVEDCKTHEAAINDTDSAQLYHRYAQAQLRLIQLQSARQTWNTIATGYSAIEQQRAALERMSRHLEQKRREQLVAERDVKRLYERYTRLNKAYILLQIENTRKLREGLKEGMACPVCGSAHHPYNTEVEQELGETQTQLERDFLEAQHQYEDSKANAAEVVAEAQACAGQLDAERLVLERMQNEQETLVSEWERFKRLDSSFAICSPSVNRDARRTSIEMLIDSTRRNIEEYEHQISKYDFHTAQLRTLATELRKAEEKLEEKKLSVWQADTQLQLVHERVETYRSLMTESDHRLEHLYKDLDDIVTLSGWRDDNLETFSKELSELYADWLATSKNLDRCRHNYEMLLLKTQIAQTECQQKTQVVGLRREERDRLRELLSSKREQLRKDFGSTTPAEYARMLQASVEDARQRFNESVNVHNERIQQMALLEGKRTGLVALRRQQEERVHEHSVTLDHAIARYNLTHDTIMSSELAAIFSDTRDWMLLRQTITDCRDALIIATEHMKIAEKRHMTLQNAPERPSKDRDEDKLENLERRNTEIVLTLEALRGELADIRRILNRHEES